MSNFVKPFKYNEKTYFVSYEFIDNNARAILHANEYFYNLVLNKEITGIHHIRVDQFEDDFKLLFKFIDNNKNDINKYKKLYATNKADSTVINWFNNTPIVNIEGFSLANFMETI